MYKLLPGLLLVVITAVLLLQQPDLRRARDTGDAWFEGTVVEITAESEEETFNGLQYVQTLQVDLEDGRRVEVENEGLSVASQRYEVGDALVVVAPAQADGTRYFAVEPARRGTLLLLFALFVGAVVLVSRWQGVRALLGMAFSFVVIFQFILPQLLTGAHPILTVLFGSLFIIPGTFYLSHGLNKKTTVAVVGTLITLIITGILASVFVEAGHLTGLASEEAAFLKIDTGETIHFQGLLLAGIIISLLGILDDVTVSQASVVEQLKAARSMSFVELYGRAMKVGRDHIGSMVNTLVLVYTGASLPLLLLFMIGAQPFSQVLNFEFMAQEIIQTLVASIGLVLAVPITTALACMERTKRKPL